MKAELVPLNGDPPIPIVRDLTVVGRREYCDVQIPHASLSKRHAVVVRTDGLLMIRDLATTNGTKVNGQRVMWAALLPNDRISLGGYKMRVYLGPDELPSPSDIAERLRANRPAPTPGPMIDFAAPTPDPNEPNPALRALRNELAPARIDMSQAPVPSPTYQEGLFEIDENEDDVIDLE